MATTHSDPAIIPPSFCERGVDLNYSKTPIYRGFWGKGNNRGKSGFAVNRGFACLQYAYQALFGG